MKKNLLGNLDLQGYKTFASKTLFEFPGRITAIVGPNGSGKSNIADAIRWVLGEQAYSLLRGKRTTDMIFFGSEQRSRGSMASVSITFDNEDGWLPVDFTEVTITRRAYRSGENEYLINNQKVRLKEINELLANSGLGERTYTIIGQGLVDSALSQRPEDRRRFFEEAAGIGLYKGRRTDAIQKLEKTNQNITRVSDILRELSPRLRTIEKSLDKTRQYNLIHSSLENMMKEWYGYQLNQARGVLEESSQFYTSRKTELDKKQNERDAIEEKVQSIQNSINKNRDLLVDFHQQLAVLHSREEELNRENAVLDERKKSIDERMMDLDSTLALQESRFERESATIEELKEKQEKFAKEQKTITEEFINAEATLQDAVEKNSKIEDEAERLRKEVVDSESKIIELESQKFVFRKNLERNKLDLKNLQQSNENHEEELTAEKKNLEEEEKRLLENESVLKKIKEFLLENINTNKKLHHDLASVQKTISTLESAQNKIQAQIAVIEEEEQRYSRKSGSEEILFAAREKNLAGNVARVIDKIETQPQYDLAIAAALENILEGLIIDSESTPFDLLNFIKENKSERTILIPEGWNSEDLDKTVISDGKLIASKIIEGNGKEAEIIRKILRRTIIVDINKNASELWQTLKPGWQIVTLDGELFDQRGFIAAGISKHSAPIKRKRTKAELDNEEDRISKELKSKANESEEILRIETENQKEILELENQISDEETSLQELNFLIYKNQIQIEQKKKEISDTEKRHSMLSDQIVEFGEEIRQIEEEIATLKVDLECKKNETNNIEEKIDLSQVNESRLKCLDLSSKKAVISQVFKQHVQNLNDRITELEAISELKEDSKKRQKQFREDIYNLLNQKKSLVEESKKIREKIKSINTAVRPLEEDVDLIIGRQGRILNDLDGKRRSFSIAERHALQAQMKVEKARDQLNTLQEKIQDDIGFILPAAKSEFMSANPLPFDELIAGLPDVKELPKNLEEDIKHQKSLLRRIGPVNPDAENEFNEVNERVVFLETQTEDLKEAEKDLRGIIGELDAVMEKEFLKTFSKVQKEFKQIFAQLFNGGEAELFISDPEDLFESGIEIEATLPGKRKQELALLSGGERSLTAVALIFSLLRISPTPFCVLDEVDAMLDESNVARFGELLRELSESTQFIVITHNRNTVLLADVLYGVTMGKDSVSQLISLKLDQLTDEMVD
jgi:chromosome segregation protein